MLNVRIKAFCYTKLITKLIENISIITEYHHTKTEKDTKYIFFDSDLFLYTRNLQNEHLIMRNK